MRTIFLALLIFSALSAQAQPLVAPVTAEFSGSGGNLPTACAEGVVKDDSTVETGWGWVPSVIEGQYVQEYHSSEFALRQLDKVCICWLRTRDDADIDFDVVLYEDVDGQPAATPYAVFPTRATDVPLGIVGEFTEIDLGGARIPQGTFYIGARWNANVDQFFFVCGDTTPTTPRQEVWFIDDRSEGEWGSSETTEDPLFIPHRAILVRPVGGLEGVIDVPALSFLGLITLAGALSVAGLLLLFRRS
jgi:hypothetical protein